MMVYCCNVLSSSCRAKLNNRVLSKADSLHLHRGIRKVLISVVKQTENKTQEGKKWLRKTWVRLNPGGRTAACPVGQPACSAPFGAAISTALWDNQQHWGSSNSDCCSSNHIFNRPLSNKVNRILCRMTALLVLLTAYQPDKWTGRVTRSPEPGLPS